MRRRTEKELQSLAVETGRCAIGRHEWNPIPLGRLAHRRGDTTLVSADQGDHLFPGNEALGFSPSLLRVALMVGIDNPDLGAAETRKTGAVAQWQVEVVGRVDDVNRGVYRVLGIHANLAARSRQCKERSDYDFR
jgi:hypothetical protein